MSTRRMRYKMALPALYMVIALGAWFDFARLPPDGLANLGLMLVVLPITALDLALRPANNPGHSILMPDRFGYYDRSPFGAQAKAGHCPQLQRKSRRALR